jgi:hypothetical protein
MTSAWPAAALSAAIAAVSAPRTPVTALVWAAVCGRWLGLIERPAMIAEQEGWTSAKVGTLGEHLAGRALTLISFAQGPENLGTATFKIVGAPHMTPYMVSIGP